MSLAAIGPFHQHETFWLQAADSGRLELHVASERFNSGATRDGYGDVINITQEMLFPTDRVIQGLTGNG